MKRIVHIREYIDIITFGPSALSYLFWPWSCMVSIILYLGFGTPGTWAKGRYNEFYVLTDYVVTGPVNSCIDHVSPGDFRFLFTNGIYVLTGLVIMREDLYSLRLSCHKKKPHPKREN